MNEITTSTVIKKYRMELQYKGTGYCGWQIQPHQTTVQEAVSNALSHLAGNRISITGASRTDSGVHALQQVAHFYFPEKKSVPDLKKALNAILPWDIRVTSIAEVSSDFHARKWALRKRYEYHFYTGEVFPPFLHDLALHLHSGFELKPAAEAAAVLVGTHDFSAFTGSGTSIVDKVRSVSISRFRQRGSILIYRIESNGFMFHMVRNIVGTLIEAGRGKIKPSTIPSIINSLDRGQAGPTAPPQGLYLAKIWY
ncbi:MAG: tRNA pseudouridine(38-40) synthase TruA [Acidobacteriota bacterium]